LSTAREPVVRDGSQRELVIVCWDEVAFTNCEVEEAKSPVRAKSGVVVADVVVPKLVGWVKASKAEPVMLMGEEPRTLKVEQETPEEHVTEVVAVLPSVVTPDVLVMYASPEMAMSDEVAIWYRSFWEKDVPSYVSPVPAVVVAAPYTSPAPFTASPVEVIEGSQREPKIVCCVEEAFTNCEVEEAKSPVRAHKGVVVAEVEVPKEVG
jgi:hypothetical protein